MTPYNWLRQLVLTILLTGICYAMSPHDPGQVVRESITLNGDWAFMPMERPWLNYPPEGKWAPEKIQVPSPWNYYFDEIGGPWRAYRNYDYPEYWRYCRAAWYERNIPVSNSMKEKVLKGGRIILTFKGVMHRSLVMVNGKRVGENQDGYLPFSFDITDLIRLDDLNKLDVYVSENPQPKGQYIYPPGSWFGWQALGIWQDVELSVVPPVRVVDTRIITSVRNQRISVQTILQNDNTSASSVTISPVIKNSNQTIKSLKPYTLTLDSHSQKTIHWSEDWKHPKLWSPESPHLYTLETQLEGIFGKDVQSNRFGFREFWIDGKYYYLNNHKIKLKGDGWHFMGPVQQNTEYAKAWYKMVKKAGGNFVRLHAMPYPEFYLDVADEEGMLIIDESALYGSRGNLALGEPNFWDNCREHTRRFINRDKNHPSVIIWSLSNEVVWRGGSNSFAPLLSLASTAQSLDPSRVITFDENDSDLGGKSQTYGGHYNSIEYWKNRNIQNKPFHLNEYGSLYYSDCHEPSYFGGESVYRSFTNRLESVGEEMRRYTWYLREMDAASFSPWNLVWYCHHPLPTIRQYPDWNKLHIDKGLKPESIGPNSVTLNWGFTPFEPQSKPNPAWSKITQAYTPVAVHIHEYNNRFYSNSSATRTVYIFNDQPKKENFEIKWELKRKNIILQKDSFAIKMEPYGMTTCSVTLFLPDYQNTESLSFKVQLQKQNTVIHEDKQIIEVFPKVSWIDIPRVVLLDDKKETASLFNHLGIKFDTINTIEEISINKGQTLIVGANSLTQIPSYQFFAHPKIESFLQQGGRIICLENALGNNPSNPIKRLDKSVKFSHPGVHTHSILTSFKDNNLKEWGPDEVISRSVFPRTSQGDSCSLIDVGDFDGGLSYSTLLEFHQGNGLILLNQMDIIRCARQEPAAELLLKNILDYATHYQASPIRTFNYQTEKKSPLWNLMTTNGFTQDSSLSNSEVLMIDGQSLPVIKAMAAHSRDVQEQIKSGSVLWVQEITPDTLPYLQQMLNIPIYGEACQEQNLIKAGNHLLLEGLNESDFCWANSWTSENIVNFTISIDSTIPHLPLLQTTDVKWALYGSKAEQFKTGYMLRTLGNFDKTRYGLILIPYGKGQVILSQLCLTNAVKYKSSANRILNRLLANMDIRISSSTNQLAQAQPSLIDDAGFIRSWLICGPYKNIDEKTLLTKDYLEVPLYYYPKEGAKIGNKTWRAINTNQSHLDFYDIDSFKNMNQSAGYATIYFYSTKNLEALLDSPNMIYLSTGYDDSIQISLNWEIVHQDERRGLYQADRKLLGPLKIRQGWNILTIKSAHYNRDWKFSARLVHQDGRPVKDLTYSLEPPR